MKTFIAVIALTLWQLSSIAQSLPWNNAKEWKIYETVDHDAFYIKADSLRNQKGRPPINDNINFYLSDAKPIPRKDNPLWMGAYLMSYTDSAGVFRKFLVSTYGGFVFDDGTKTHYLLQEYKWEGWKEFVESSYDQFH